MPRPAAEELELISELTVGRPSVLRGDQAITKLGRCAFHTAKPFPRDMLIAGMD